MSPRLLTLAQVIGRTVEDIYEWREFDAQGIDKGDVYIRLNTQLDSSANQGGDGAVLPKHGGDIIGVPHFFDELNPSYRIDRVLDKRAKSVFFKRKKIFRVKTPLAKKLKGQAITAVHFDDEKGYYELANGCIISENLALPHGLNAAGLVMFDSLSQMRLLDGDTVLQRLEILDV